MDELPFHLARLLLLGHKRAPERLWTAITGYPLFRQLLRREHRGDLVEYLRLLRRPPFLLQQALFKRFEAHFGVTEAHHVGGEGRYERCVDADMRIPLERFRAEGSQALVKYGIIFGELGMMQESQRALEAALMLANKVDDFISMSNKDGGTAKASGGGGGGGGGGLSPPSHQQRSSSRGETGAAKAAAGVGREGGSSAAAGGAASGGQATQAYHAQGAAAAAAGSGAGANGADGGAPGPRGALVAIEANITSLTSRTRAPSTAALSAKALRALSVTLLARVSDFAAMKASDAAHDKLAAAKNAIGGGGARRRQQDSHFLDDMSARLATVRQLCLKLQYVLGTHRDLIIAHDLRDKALSIMVSLRRQLLHQHGLVGGAGGAASADAPSSTPSV